MMHADLMPLVVEDIVWRVVESRPLSGQYQWSPEVKFETKQAR